MDTLLPAPALHFSETDLAEAGQRLAELAAERRPFGAHDLESKCQLQDISQNGCAVEALAHHLRGKAVQYAEQAKTKHGCRYAETYLSYLTRATSLIEYAAATDSLY